MNAAAAAGDGDRTVPRNARAAAFASSRTSTSTAPSSVVLISEAAVAVARDQLAVYEDSCFWFVDDVRREAEAETTDVLGFTEASAACEGAGYHLVDEIDSVGAAFIKTR